jgi:hypothetical protein
MPQNTVCHVRDIRGAMADLKHHPSRPPHGPYWKRAHHDWRFWVAFFLMFAAMFIYLSSFDLARRPRLWPLQPPSGAIGK